MAMWWFPNRFGLISEGWKNFKIMTLGTRNIHGLPTLMVAALFFTLSFFSWADESKNAPASSAPVITAPAAGTNPAPGVNLPASGSDKTLPDKAGAENQADQSDQKHSSPKPMVVHTDRDFEIAHKVAVLMEENHYLQKPIDAEMSQHWLSNYFLALDQRHLFFLQGDIDEFTAKYGNNLGDLIHGDSDEAAIAPAFEIFKRYLQRVSEDVALAKKVVHDKFDFMQDETFTIPTDKSPWLKDAATAETTWRKEVKSDMLLNDLLEKKTPEATVKRNIKRYDSLLLEAQEMDDMDVLEAYLSALTHAYDPHSDYLSPMDTQDFTIKAINLSVTGIGAELRADDGYATIENVIPGGPADLDKRLQAGDRIIAVGQGNSEPVDAVDMKLGKVVEMIRGRKGTVVHLVILQAGGTDAAVHKDIFLKRDVVSIKESLAKAQIIEHPVAGGGTVKVGVIDLPEFYSNTATDVARLVLRLKKEKVAGIILDLRNNGGGLLDQAVDLTGLFVKREPVVQIRSSDNNIGELDTGESPQIYNGPLLVMVNKASASATEIVAGALQDYGRAVIVGDQSTHGKGTVQRLISLMPLMSLGFPSEPGAGDLKLTVQKFYRVAGGSTQQKGVVPDIVLPSLLDALELGETTLPYYLTYDEVPKANYDYLDLTGVYLPALRANSAARVAASPDFDYVRHGIDYYRKKRQDPTLSLNLAVEQKQADDLKAFNTQCKKALETRKASRGTVLELTLDMVDQNLPAAPPKDKKPRIAFDDESQEDADLETALKDLAMLSQLDEAVNIMADYDQMLRDAGSKLVQTSPLVPSK
jgi:carboxyl-terminal processing protease